jgi:glyoxylase-like metal-dependent hydrolase (beta-lactamase superfamily II)
MANTYLIDDGQFIIVDPGSDLNVRKLSDYLPRFLHRSLADIDLIVLTHLHPDHTAGVGALRQLCSAPVAASAVVYQLQQVLEQGKLIPPLLAQLTEQLRPGPLRYFDIFPPFYERQMKLVDLWLTDVDGLPGHPSWRVIASPGHTPESLCLYNPFTYELLCGDTVITVQGGAPLLRSGTNRQRLEETLQVLRSLNVHYLYPGHGRPILGLHPLNNVDVEW